MLKTYKNLMQVVKSNEKKWKRNKTRLSMNVCLKIILRPESTHDNIKNLPFNSVFRFFS